MTRLAQFARRIAKDERGAALIEYTILLGMLVVGVVVTIGLVGNWVNTQWTTMLGLLP